MTRLLTLPNLFALLLVALAQTGGFTLQAERGRALSLELVAYILQANGYPAAGAELRADGLERLVIKGP